MAIDYSIELDCEVRRALAGEDAAQGTTAILDALKAQNRAASTRQRLAEAGQDALDYRIVVKEIVGQKVVERNVSLADLDREAQRLSRYAQHCRGCRANMTGELAGCTNAISYPIAQAVEEYLLAHIQEERSLTGGLLLKTIKDMQLAGSPVAQMRRQGLLERTAPLKKKIKSGLLGGTYVTSDQILQFVLAAGAVLSAKHCCMFLLLVGRLRPSRQQSGEAADFVALMNLPVAQREAGSMLLQEDGSDTEPAARLLRTFHRAWTLDVTLRMLP